MVLEEKTDEKLEINANDLIHILLAFRKGDKFPGLVSISHTAAYRVIKDNPQIDVGFDTNGTHPYSEDLYEAMGMLKISGVLEGALFKRDYSIGLSQKLLIENLHKRFGENYIGLEPKFRAWAEKFYEEVAKLESERLSLQAS